MDRKLIQGIIGPGKKEKRLRPNFLRHDQSLQQYNHDGLTSQSFDRIMSKNETPIQAEHVIGQQLNASANQDDDSTTQHSAANSANLIYIKTGNNGKKIIGLKNKSEGFSEIPVKFKSRP